MILMSGLLFLNLVLTVSAKIDGDRTFQDVLTEDWYFGAVERVGSLGLMGRDLEGWFFAPQATVNRAELATVLGRTLDYNTAYNLYLALLQWSMHQEKPQMISSTGVGTLLDASGEKASNGEWGVIPADFSEFFLERVEAADDSTISKCFAELYDYENTELTNCEDFLGDMTMTDSFDGQYEY